MRIRRYRYAETDPRSIYEVFTMVELMDRVAIVWHPWNVHRLERMTVVQFLN